MSDIPCPYILNNRAIKPETVVEVDKDETDQSCLNGKELDVNNIKRKGDIQLVKEQNYFIENGELLTLSQLFSNRNYVKSAFNSNKRSGACEIRNTSVEHSNHVQNEKNTPFTNDSKIPQETKICDNEDIYEKQNKSFETQLNKLNCTPSKSDFNSASNTSNEIYYAVYIPLEFSLSDVVGDRKENIHVYTDKEEVLKLIKTNKKARFKRFKTRKEAEEFAVNGAEIISMDGLSGIADNEKVMPFKRPKTEDMIQFRKDIERGNIEAVQQKIFENPKYLVSNGDTPSILQEGSRYNALHVAAKVKNAKITRLILDSITRIDFIGYLYDDNDIDSCISRSKILLDRYLNTPDKGSNETPLHLAVKHGAVEVVQVLLSYSQCQKNNIFNKYKELPKDIICSRVCEPCDKAKAAIASMLEEQYFVPVLRSEDNSLQPRVGEAFSISNPLKLESDLLSPRLEIQAYAGPMSKEKADIFKKKWKTPTRCINDVNSPLALRLRDTEKGLEKTGRNLASELDVPWQEYWSFLDTFVDIASESGLDLLENYLKNRFKESFLDFKNERDGNCEKSLIENYYCPISDLCEAFEMCGSQDKYSPTNYHEASNPAFRSKRQSSSPSIIQRDHFGKKSDFSTNYIKNPVIYVERSCEVFGKRIGAAISSCVLFENQTESLKDSLETQIKHLHTLIKSYKEDTRFQSVDFQLVHSRVAAVAIQNLQNVIKESHLILSALKGIDWSNGALSDDEDLTYNCKNCNDAVGGTTKQLHCLVKHLIIQLYDSPDGFQLSPSALTEEDCQILWAQATPCGCSWSKSAFKRARGALKRKQLRSELEYESDLSPKKIQFESEKEEFSDALEEISDDTDHFSTPPSGNSDSEEDVMQDVTEIPNTFIFPGSLPSKTDYAVLDAIDKVPLSHEKYPNIYLWRHILKGQPKKISIDCHYSESVQRKLLNFDSPKSSPCKLDLSIGSCESPPIKESVMEPWERVTGPYSPRRSSRSSLSMLYYQDSSISR